MNRMFLVSSVLLLAIGCSSEPIQTEEANLGEDGATFVAQQKLSASATTQLVKFTIPGMT